MREKTFHVYVDSHDRSLLLQSLAVFMQLFLVALDKIFFRD